MKPEESYQLPTMEDDRAISPRPGRSHPSWGVILAVAAICTAAAAILYHGISNRVRAANDVKEVTRELAVPVVSIAQPKTGAAQQELVLPGNIQAFIDAPIYARTNGYLKKWYVDIGAKAAQGQLLAEIETPELDQQLQQGLADVATANANFELAQTTAARYESLLKSDSVAKQDVDNAEGDAKSKKAMVDSANDNVKRLEQLQDYEKVYSPFAGVVTARNTDIGQLITSGSASGAKELFHVASISTMRVYVNVPQRYSPSTTPGVESYLTLPQYPGQQFPGRLVRTSNAIDQASRTLWSKSMWPIPRARFFPVPIPRFISSCRHRPLTVVIPVTSLIFRSEGLRVAVLRNKHAVMIPVTLGRDFGTEVEVASGVESNDRVITNPPDSLLDGEEVRITTPSGNGNDPEGKGF